MTAVPRLNVNTPFLKGVPNSQVSREWFIFLNNICTILGGGQDVIIDINDLTSITNTAVVTTDTTGLINDILARVVSIVDRSIQYEHNVAATRSDYLEERIRKLESTLSSLGNVAKYFDAVSLMESAALRAPIVQPVIQTVKNSASNVTLPTGAATGIVSVPITPGTWLLFGNVSYNFASLVTASEWAAEIGTSVGFSANPQDYSVLQMSSSVQNSILPPPFTISVNADTTCYLTGYAVFTGAATTTANASLTAVKVNNLLS